MNGRNSLIIVSSPGVRTVGISRTPVIGGGRRGTAGAVRGVAFVLPGGYYNSRYYSLIIIILSLIL